MINAQMMESLERFINSSSMNVERIPEDLRKALHIPSKMDEVCAVAVEKGFSIIVAGTAGSGKTHLVKQLCSTNPNTEQYSIILDLTAEREQWLNILDNKKYIICGNEGIFDLAALEDKRFKEVITNIHSLQNGNVPKLPYLLIDASGFSHITAGILKKVLKLPILNEYIKVRGDLRANAFWNLLKNDKVVSRLEDVLIKASIYSDASSITMREFWRFICELINCSPNIRRSNDWVHNLFYGKTEVSNMIRDFSNFGQYAIPIIGTRISLRDLSLLEEKSIPEFSEIRKYLQPEESKSNYTSDELNFLRLLTVFVLADSPLDKPLAGKKELWKRINLDTSKDSPSVCAEILNKINDYLSYGLGTNFNQFELFTDYRLEYKQKKSKFVISLGQIQKKEFSFIKNSIHSSIDGIEAIDPYEYGNRYYVNHGDNVSLRITKQMIDKIHEIRSSRTYDSLGSEMDWRLFHFNDQLAITSNNPERKKRLLFIQREARNEKEHIFILNLEDDKIFVERP